VSVDPSRVRLFIPDGLKKFKLKLFESIGLHIRNLGGDVIQGDHAAVGALPDELIPIIGCTPQFRPFVEKWRISGRQWIYWDRGYLRRVFATWLPDGHDLGVPGGYYRWHLNQFQMTKIRDVPDDRWRALKLSEWSKAPRPWLKKLPVEWRKGGKHVVVADTGHDYWDFHADRNWSRRTADALRKYTDRPIIFRNKECKIPLYDQLVDAHALVTHGSVAAVEAAVMGVPVIVHPDSAAASVGVTDISRVEDLVYPDRGPWLRSLAYGQFNERELIDGTLWRLIA